MAIVYAAIGGMQLKSWTGYFKIIWPTIRVLGQAKKADGCIHADMFKDQNVYFAVSVWKSTDAMRAFANSGLHSSLKEMAMDTMSVFHNHTKECDEIPNRKQCVEYWQAEMVRRSGQGSVGVYQA